MGQPAADRDYRPGHERMLALLHHFPAGQPKLRIRVAGTNGKGSTSNFVAAALQALGYRVGLFTSPHISQFNERIRINGEPVADELLAEKLSQMVPTALEIGASYFEVATALALRCFAEAAIEVEVFEAGVGARLDATTALPSDLALLTPIGLDHQAWLGDTLIWQATRLSYIFQAAASQRLTCGIAINDINIGDLNGHRTIQ
ncbi:MAG: hypothetical protein CO186_11985 [Zetaproteobacteria bacterium CG_4_9_14_3_um_filter_49_83]|nr:MAG: hypothetical protein COW62_01845 [Zetaproteobacteria bacterium CG17_big_fil_post_rev_8_21_14_2_50_50_13]PIV29074.1 MAG: hypothetical protein COS35_13995 [Zetaproteobacteria bacterium CG02_land_8_20_14_3_00_50_9]PIY56452.1 MAG: hypothetical protein COZ00_04345 [Zetaproteobacteria bacterium CG_4_10_14_0_8_um_filter_49_80]PJA34092.1 MAG: hypothetical protein CO186_11985 [Zetaproteobacteria bacterium CG_4_9_14_3_um_filter_49_83]